MAVLTRLLAGSLLWLMATALLCLPVYADPWAVAGDVGLRHDLTVLADAGVVKAPLTTWPLSWGDLSRDVFNLETGLQLDPGQLAALDRIRVLARRAAGAGQLAAKLRVSASKNPRPIRTFAATPRESGEVSGALSWTGMRFSYTLQATAVADPADDRTVRLDGSVAGFAAGNYMISIGEMERWWGPGWEGSLILSTNARPIPSLAIRRNISDPFQHPWLRWIGPWTVSALWGKLESGRFVPDARFFGLRVNFRPLPSLEIGISRTAQWCGQGRPCDFGTFVDLLAGNDNRGADLAVEDEPGNQLAGFDWRYSMRGWGLPTAFYGQFIGEDEAGGFPSRYLGMVGLELSGITAGRVASYRLYLEAVDTASEFYASETRFDYVYEHFIYKDGYRYRGRSIGHAIDADGRMLSLGGFMMDWHANTWQFMVRIGELNRAGDTTLAHSVSRFPRDYLNVEVGHSRPVADGQFEVWAGFDRRERQDTGKTSNEFSAMLSWSQDF